MNPYKNSKMEEQSLIFKWGNGFLEKINSTHFKSVIEKFTHETEIRMLVTCILFREEIKKGQD